MLCIGFVCFLVGELMLAIGFVCLFFVNLYIYPENPIFCKTRIGHLGLGKTEEASGCLRKLGLNRYVYDKIMVQTDQKNGS